MLLLIFTYILKLFGLGLIPNRIRQQTCKRPTRKAVEED